jgi:hypothetical protein
MACDTSPELRALIDHEPIIEARIRSYANH